MADRETIAALYDIHGNLPALEAALGAAEAAGAGEIVVGGDIVLGPMPRETMDRVIALGPRARCIRGNCDRLVVDAFDGRLDAGLPPAIRETITWTARQLDREHRDFLAGLPMTLSANVQALGAVLFCHATPRSDEEILTAITPDEDVGEMLGGVTQPVVVCGHTHIEFDRTFNGVRVVNAGSVGMPYGVPGAHWVLLRPGVRMMRTPYDFELAARLVRDTTYPGAAEFASGSVLDPPDEQDMMMRLESHAR